VDELVSFHLARIEALAAAEPDLLAIETIPSIAEAEALARVLGPFDLPRVSAGAGVDAEQLRELLAAVGG